MPSETKPFKVLFVPSASDRIAATRYRVGLWVKMLEARGIRCGVYPAISDRTTQLMLRSPTLPRWRRLAYYARIIVERLWRAAGLLARLPGYDILFLQRATLPWGTAFPAALLTKAIVFDFDDAIFMADPGDGEAAWLRRLKTLHKASGLRRTLRAAKAAVVSNEYLAEYARPLCPEVVRIPGPVDTDALQPKAEYSDRPPVIGWIGSPATASYLPLVEEALLEVLRRHPGARVRLIGAGPFRFRRLDAEFLPWRLESETEDIRSFDIGIMPLPDNAWTHGKFGIKLALYMAAGVPAVASYTRSTAAEVSDGHDAFLARDPEEWISILCRLAADPGLRRRIGSAGRRSAEEKFSVKAGAPKLLALFERLLNAPRDCSKIA